MNRKAAIILSGAFTPEMGAEGSWRFGHFKLLERVAEVAAAVAPVVVVIPAVEAFPARFAAGPLAAARVGPPPVPAGGLAPALATGLGLVGGDAEEVAVIPAGLPYLTAKWLQGLFDALTPGVPGVCAVEGERRRPLLAVYPVNVLREALRGGTAPREGLFCPPEKMAPYPVAPAGPQGCSVATAIATGQDYRAALAHLGFCEAGQPPVTVEVFGTLSIRTGLAHLPIYADSVGRACEVLRRVYPETERLLPGVGAMGDYFRFSINGKGVTTDLSLPMQEGDHLILFSASVGG